MGSLTSDPTADALDTIACATEAIHLPGRVQQHGFFLLTEASFDTVLVASRNAENFLGLPLRLILGARLDTLLEREVLRSLHLLRSQPQTERQGMVTYVGSFHIRGEMYSVTSHCVGGQRAIEFEREERLVGSEMMNSVITNFVSALSRLGTESDMCEALVHQIAELTGFDRVLLYSFDEEGHGTVLAEVNNGRLPSYLGLRFPSSDIPQQARDLYVLNTVRIIPDANYTPSPLMTMDGRHASTIDLSLSVLRSVSPIHLEYMRNMGTLSSMSVSLVSGGQLWGLISGHHAQPKVVPYLVRSACDMLTKMAGTQLTSFRTAARLQQAVHFHSVQRSVLTVMAAEQNYLDGLMRRVDSLLEVTNAAGVALVVDHHVTRSGELPADADIERIADWLDRQSDLDLFVTSHLTEELPWAERIRDVASGLLAVRVSSVQRRYLLWFRPEIVRTVRWAGEPIKVEDAERHLHPRASFDEWREVVHGRSAPWSPVEVESARDFRSALTTIGLRRAEEAVELGEARFQQLTQSLPVKIFTADDSGRLTYVNERWHDSGLSVDGRWFEQERITPEDAELCAIRWQQAVNEGSSFEAEVRLRPPEGTPERWNFVRAVPFQRAGAQRAGWIGTLIDLTESKERETALRMSEKLALTGRMTSVIAHEINNPLEAITNLMYLLRNEVRSNGGPACSYIGMVESELERISGITKQTLRWNRETSDQMVIFAAGPMVDDVLRLFAGKVRNRQITIRVSGTRSAQIGGILGQIRQVLANLVSNAIDAAPVGGQVSISIVDDEGSEEVGLVVRDNGRGMEPSVRDRVFEPFYSTKGDLGNGLGLYISKEIIERHGGRIDVDSVIGVGTTMSVWVPRSAAEMRGNAN